MSINLSGICGLQVQWTVELWKVISWSEFSWIQALLCDKHIYVNVISWKVWPLSKPYLFWEKHCLRCSPAYCWSTWSTICFLSLPSSGNQCSENGNVEIYMISTENYLCFVWIHLLWPNGSLIGSPGLLRDLFGDLGPLLWPRSPFSGIWLERRRYYVLYSNVLKNWHNLHFFLFWTHYFGKVDIIF